MADNKECWEMQTGGTVWVNTTLDAAKGTTKSTSVKGKGSLLYISAEDRKVAMERVRDKKNDPFTNGMLLRKDADQNQDPETKSPSAASDDDLRAMFKIKTIARFTTAVDDLSEVSLRRLVALAQTDETITAAQKERLTQVLNDKYGPNKGKEDVRHLEAEELAARFPVTKLSG